MKKLFISQPMNGKTDDEIYKERDAAVKRAQEVLGEEVVLIDSYITGCPADAKPLWFLGESLKKLSNADVAYFCKDWENYRGCCMEFDACSRYGIRIIEEPKGELK